MEWDVQKCFVPRTGLTSTEFCSSNFVRNIPILCLYGLVLYFLYIAVQDVVQCQFIQPVLFHGVWSSHWKQTKNANVTWEVGRNDINFALLYKEPFLASADGFDSLILTLGCLSDFWRFSSLQDRRGDKQRERQPLHSHHCWLALSKSTEQGHGELHLWGTCSVLRGNISLILVLSMCSSGVFSLIKCKHDFTFYLASGRVPDHIPGSSWTFANDLHLQVKHRCSRDGKMILFQC